MPGNEERKEEGYWDDEKALSIERSNSYTTLFLMSLNCTLMIEIINMYILPHRVNYIPPK